MDRETFLELKRKWASERKEKGQVIWYSDMCKRKNIESIEHIIFSCCCSAEILPVLSSEDDGGFHWDGYCLERPFVA